MNAIVDVNIGTDGGANELATFQHTTDVLEELSDFYYSPDILADFISFLVPLSFPNEVDANIDSQNFHDDESNILWQHFDFSPAPISLFLDVDLSFAFKVYNGPRKFLDLSKEPLSYMEAMSRPDADHGERLWNAKRRVWKKWEHLRKRTYHRVNARLV
jgi:hypothetical protein